jgi:hypothetical protein
MAGRKRKGNAGRTAAIVVVGLGLIVGLAVIGADWRQRYQALSKESARWRITGAPCQLVSREVFSNTADPFAIRPYATDLKLTYGDLVFMRNSGDAYCEDVMLKDNVWMSTSPVCQFAHPRKVALTGPAGSFYFLTGEGAATVVVPETGSPTCVRGGWYQRGAIPR